MELASDTNTHAVLCTQPYSSNNDYHSGVLQLYAHHTLLRQKSDSPVALAAAQAAAAAMALTALESTAKDRHSSSTVVKNGSLAASSKHRRCCTKGSSSLSVSSVRSPTYAAVCVFSKLFALALIQAQFTDSIQAQFTGIVCMQLCGVTTRGALKLSQYRLHIAACSMKPSQAPC